MPTIPFYSLLTLVYLLLINKKIDKNNSIYIFSLSFIIFISVYSFYQYFFIPFSAKFDSFFVSFVAIFAGFYYVFKYFFGHFKINGIINITINYQKYHNFSIFLSFISIILFLRYFITMPFSMLREQVIHEGLSFYVGISFPFVASCLYYQNIYNIKKGRLVLVALCVILAIISTSKQFFVMTLLYAVPWYKKDYKINILYIIVIAFFGFLLFSLNHVLREIGQNHGNFWESNFRTLLGYFLGGLAAFQLHLDYVPLSGFVETGEWWGNVYTGFYNFFEDYDWYVLTIKVMGMSLFYAIFDSYKSRYIQAHFISIFGVFPLIFIVFSDMFYHHTLLTYIIVGICLGFVKK